MSANENDLEALFKTNFSCKICSKILYDPVQCQHNEHYFCRKCITKHLVNSETCPRCADNLTLETLRPPSQIVRNVVSQMKKQSCSNVSRGCPENVKIEELLLHEQSCGYAPVVCSNEGCNETVNREDIESHETQECTFRKIACDSCGEVMIYAHYEKHLCSLREEMNNMKSRLDRVSRLLKQMSITQAKLEKKLEAREKNVEPQEKLLPYPVTEIEEASTDRVMKGKIFIIGGSGYFEKSVDVFDWATGTWTLFKECLLSGRCHSIVFLQGKKIIIYGGECYERSIECLEASGDGYSSSLLPGSLRGHYNRINGIFREDRVITFHQNVLETKIESPEDSRVLLYERYGITRLACSVVSFQNNIYIIGGQPSTMERYDLVKNEVKYLPPVPYHVTRMAAVVYKDNIVIVGGEGRARNPLNDVVMFNVTSQKYKTLPSMLQKRAGCAAVIVGDTIVVMGGGRRNRKNCMGDLLKSVECYVIGQDTWQEMPAMNRARACATACVYE